MLWRCERLVAFSHGFDRHEVRWGAGRPISTVIAASHGFHRRGVGGDRTHLSDAPCGAVRPATGRAALIVTTRSGRRKHSLASMECLQAHIHPQSPGPEFPIVLLKPLFAPTADAALFVIPDAFFVPGTTVVKVNATTQLSQSALK
jgi:hypothetical protein